MTTHVTAENGKQDIWIKRQFNAPKNLVYRLISEEELIVQWQVDSFNFIRYEGRNGGMYESTHIGPDGNTYGFKGVFHEIIPNECIIKTSEFLGLPFKVIPTLEIHSVEELNTNKTLLTIQIICNNEEVRDSMVQHGMQEQFDTIFTNFDKTINTLI